MAGELTIFDPGALEAIQKVGNVFAGSNLVPEHFRNKPENCAIACMMAARIGVDPFTLMQNIYVVHGKPAFEAKFIIGMCNSAGVFAGPIEYETGGSGDSTWCVAVAKLRSGQVVRGPAVSIQMAKAEGWYDKSGSKWKTMPNLMLRYRAAVFLIRTTCPEVMFGMQTSEEVFDVGPEGYRVDHATRNSAPMTAAELLGQQETPKYHATDASEPDTETDDPEPEPEPAHQPEQKPAEPPQDPREGASPEETMRDDLLAKYGSGQFQTAKERALKGAKLTDGIGNMVQLRKMDDWLQANGKPR